MGKRRTRRHHRPKTQSFERKEKSKSSSFYLKKFFFWFAVYFISISLLTTLFLNTQIYTNKVGFYLIMGFLLVLLSRVIYSATKNKELRLSGIVIWGIVYAVVFGLLDYFLTKLPQVNLNSSYDLYISIAIFSVLFTIILMFLRRMKIKSNRRVRAPSQIFTGILLLIAGILSWRFSKIVFLDWFNWAEGMAWSWLIGLALIIAGFLVLLAWWRNNVLQHRFGVKIGKW